ncbi:interferon alpha-inducible protein 27, mitochondrial-like [Entelurus aequoreus]|uniref:interferon alpha-inducible protein 27, mitochondrial-like n=1 Tax=Entelurus aequoreus TaxID=161455 RepID=UPI002B1DB74A|nr:interferon alpha-inducible protein 27, mitochondrial-like [Entelurus aequoreus]
MQAGIVQRLGDTMGSSSSTSSDEAESDVSAMGFTTDGITKGSRAADMMSSEAIDNGGGVPSGGPVSDYQSMGARGHGGKNY